MIKPIVTDILFKSMMTDIMQDDGSITPPIPYFFELENGSGFFELENGTGMFQLEV